MEVFTGYLANISDSQRRARTEEVLRWVGERFPDLVPRVAWNQPMFTDHGTFIIGFSVAKHHLAVSPEKAGIEHFSEAIKRAGYEHSMMLLRMPWDRPINFDLLASIIEYNVAEKAQTETFWRK